MTNIIATFIIAYTVALLVYVANTSSNLFVQVSAWILAVIFGIAVLQNLFRGRKG